MTKSTTGGNNEGEQSDQHNNNQTKQQQGVKFVARPSDDQKNQTSKASTKKQ